ncbi:MAG: hypothetical protein HKN73_06185 [Gemmatimonadetes bacterium]|nr:hypothetical protein [Gemmatimonadota bacterium]
MMDSAEREARRALARLQRALEKTQRELGTLRGALETAEGDDFPGDEYEAVDELLRRAGEFASTEGRRLQAKILAAGGVEPGRVRRTGGL